MDGKGNPIFISKQVNYHINCNNASNNVITRFFFYRQLLYYKEQYSNLVQFILPISGNIYLETDISNWVEM